MSSTPPPVPPGPAREMRLVDQAASMHAALRDRAAGASTAITVLLLCASAVGTALAFAGNDDSVRLLGVEASKATWLGALSVTVFCGTLAELVLDRRGAARRHGEAVRLLAGLKAAYRQVAADGDWDTAAPRLSERYGQVMDAVPPVPEARFNDLKARHLRKVEISKLLSERPGLTVRQAKKELKRRVER